MMGASQPGFEVGEYEMNDGHERFRYLRIAPRCDRHVVITSLGKLAVAAPVIGDDPCAWRHGTLDEGAERLGTAVWNQGKSNATCVPPGFALIETAVGTLALADFDSTGHGYHVMDTAPLATRTASQPGFIGLYDVARLAANPILVGSHHAGSKLVENLEGGFVA